MLRSKSFLSMGKSNTQLSDLRSECTVPKGLAYPEVPLHERATLSLSRYQRFPVSVFMRGIGDIIEIVKVVPVVALEL
jgi:hypothetical protein